MDTGSRYNSDILEIPPGKLLQGAFVPEILLYNSYTVLDDTKACLIPEFILDSFFFCILLGHEVHILLTKFR